jgi:2'-5' RNA ligase
MRIFISLELPETLKAKIFHNFEKLKNSGTCSGNFVSKNNLHITLRFLGELSEDKIEELIKVFSNFSSSSFEISLGKKGYFPDKDYIRVLWLSLISDKLTDFFSKIEEVLQNLGYEKEKDFVFHLTVARIKSIKK